MIRTIPTSTQGRTDPLDYVWWASDGPTAGYLTRRALEARRRRRTSSTPCSSARAWAVHCWRAPGHLRDAGPAEPAAFGLATVTYRQLGPFAIALPIVGDGEGDTEPGD